MLQLYKRRGINVAVHYETNKAAVWKAAGIDYAPLPAPYVQWGYHAGFNAPQLKDGPGNKVYQNLTRPPLPPIGDLDALWQELLDVRLTFDALLTADLVAEAERFLDGCPRPIVLLHTNGTNMPASKNLPAPVTRELYDRLLDAMPGTLVLLDWDHRVPMLQHGRIRHLKRDWGHASLEQLAALMSLSALLIGVDSGPFHFAAFSTLPTLGVFSGHYPASVTLPRPSAAVMTRSADSYRPVNQARRQRWNVIEYAGQQPTAEEIARHALRMLAGPRYLPSAFLGRDVMLQQWVRDWCRASTSTSPRADRDVTMDYLLRQLVAVEAPTIVETGCVRSREDWSAGYSSYLWAAFVGAVGGRLTSVDNSAGNVETARGLVSPWSADVEFVCADSVTYLSGLGPCDLLYLDSLDCESPRHAEHGLAELRAAHPRLRPGTLVAIDDTVWAGGWKGKGAAAVPWGLQHGYRVEAAGYQVVLRKP